MTFITSTLEELIKTTRKTHQGRKYEDHEAQIIHENYDAGYEEGLEDALYTVRAAEKELEKRIWQAWVNEGVEPK